MDQVSYLLFLKDVEDSSFDLSILRTCRAVHDFIQSRFYKSVILKPSSSLSTLIGFVHGLGLIQMRGGRVAINKFSVFVEDESRQQVGPWRH